MVTMLITIPTVTTPPGTPAIGAGRTHTGKQEANGLGASTQPEGQCGMAAAW
jgi:hypothetical protein